MGIHEQIQVCTKQNYGFGHHRAEQADQSILARAFRGELG